MDRQILEQRARAFDHLFDAIVVTDMEGIIIDWNSGSEALYGYSKDEAIGQPVSILHVPKDVDHVTAEVISAVEKDGTWSGEVRMLHKNGQIGWIESMVVPLFDENNNMVGALGINRDISERMRDKEKLAYLAHYDQLTALPNRYLFLDRLDQMIKHAKRSDGNFALLYIDLDNYKSINDLLGHATGDLVLIKTGQTLKQSLRESDTIARLGGDEFVVLLDNIQNTEEVSTVAEYLVNELHQPCEIDGHAIQLSGSIGIAIYPTNGETADTLLSFADKAMYRAKNKGKDNYQF